MLCPEEVAAMVASTAIAISKNLSSDETAMIAAILGQLGSTLVMISAVKAKYEYPEQQTLPPGIFP